MWFTQTRSRWDMKTHETPVFSKWQMTLLFRPEREGHWSFREPEDRRVWTRLETYSDSDQLQVFFLFCFFSKKRKKTPRVGWNRKWTSVNNVVRKKMRQWHHSGWPAGAAGNVFCREWEDGAAKEMIKARHGAELSPWSKVLIAVGGGHLDKLMHEVRTKHEDNLDFSKAH